MGTPRIKGSNEHSMNHPPAFSLPAPARIPPPIPPRLKPTPPPIPPRLKDRILPPIPPFPSLEDTHKAENSTIGASHDLIVLREPMPIERPRSPAFWMRRMEDQYIVWPDSPPIITPSSNFLSKCFAFSYDVQVGPLREVDIHPRKVTFNPSVTILLYTPPMSPIRSQLWYGDPYRDGSLKYPSAVEEKEEGLESEIETHFGFDSMLAEQRRLLVSQQGKRAGAMKPQRPGISDEDFHSILGLASRKIDSARNPKRGSISSSLASGSSYVPPCSSCQKYRQWRGTPERRDDPILKRVISDRLAKILEDADNAVEAPSKRSLSPRRAAAELTAKESVHKLSTEVVESLVKATGSQSQPLGRRQKNPAPSPYSQPQPGLLPKSRASISGMKLRLRKEDLEASTRRGKFYGGDALTKLISDINPPVPRKKSSSLKVPPKLPMISPKPKAKCFACSVASNQKSKFERLAK